MIVETGVKTESPIEEDLLQALCAVAGDKAVIFHVGLPTIRALALADEARRLVFIAPQVKVGRYRADFIVAAYRSGVSPTVICVECDGQQHRETRSADSDREDYFTKQNVATMRFWGWQIRKDSYACAHQIVDAVTASWPKPGEPFATVGQRIAAAIPDMEAIKARSDLRRGQP